MSHFYPGSSRREFLKTTSLSALALSASQPWLFAHDTPGATPSAESFVKTLHETFTPGQKESLCFAWDHHLPDRGLLRTHVNNNWNITNKIINSNFFTDEQRDIIRHIFEAMLQPEWVTKIDQQLTDDAGGFGEDQSIAIFGEPGSEQFEFVMTGRHMTMRCDGNTTDHVCFGGPIFYGHAAEDFYESKDHKGNVFWEQALAANEIFPMLDGRQRTQALLPKTPVEGNSAFRSEIPGLPLSELTSDQKGVVEGVLKKLLEPYRATDQDEVKAALSKMGGLESCRLAFYADSDLGSDGVWDNWRLEGPAFVWHFRGNPHVHC